jgi:hypothetical protein
MPEDLRQELRRMLERIYNEIPTADRKAIKAVLDQN